MVNDEQPLVARCPLTVPEGFPFVLSTRHSINRHPNDVVRYSPEGSLRSAIKKTRLLRSIFDPQASTIGRVRTDSGMADHVRRGNEVILHCAEAFLEALAQIEFALRVTHAVNQLAPSTTSLLSREVDRSKKRNLHNTKRIEMKTIFRTSLWHTIITKLNVQVRFALGLIYNSGIAASCHQTIRV